jgi:Na+/melibiose symporter-like transporter
MFYMTNIVGIDVKLAAIAVFAPKIVDVITDPFMGVLSDRTRSRWGRRRPYMLAGALAIGPLFAMLFSVPVLDSDFASFLFVLAAFITCTLAYTVFAVPYVSLSVEIPRDYHERTLINAYRMVFVMIGILIAGGVAPMIVEAAGGGREGYRVMSISLGIACTVFMLAAFFATHHVKEPTERLLLTVRQQFSLVRKNRPFVILFATYVTQLIGMGCLSASLPYFATYIIGGGNQTIATIFITFNLTAMLAIPFWAFLSRHISKLTGYACATLLLVFAYTSLFLIDAGYPFDVFLFQVVLTGIGLGGQQLFSFSMLADTVHHGNAQLEGGKGEAIYAGFFTAGEKGGGACGAMLAGVVLGIMGLVETTEGLTEQPASALLGIKLAFSIVPAILVAISLVVMSFYRSFERQQIR